MRSNAGGDGFGAGLGHAEHGGNGLGCATHGSAAVFGDGWAKTSNNTQSTSAEAASQGDGSWGYVDGSGTDGSP